MFKLPLLSLLSLANCLTKQPQHIIELNGGLIFIFFVFACVGGCGYCYFRCCRRGRQQYHQHQTGRGGWFSDDSSDSSDHRRRPPPPPPPVFRGYPPNSAPYQAAPPMGVPVNRYHQPAPFVSQNDVTRAVNQDRFMNSWEGPDYLAQKKLREPCGYCNQYSRYGQEPKLMLNCPEHHTFHSACLNQHRIATRSQFGQGRTICPACSAPSTEKIRYFCTRCKEKYVWVDLNLYSDEQGVIDTTRLTSYYGQTCPDCR